MSGITLVKGGIGKAARPLQMERVANPATGEADYRPKVIQTLELPGHVEPTEALRQARAAGFIDPIWVLHLAIPEVVGTWVASGDRTIQVFPLPR